MKRFLTTVNDYGPSGVLPITDTCTHNTLAAATAERITVPEGAQVVVLTSFGANSYFLGYSGSPDEAAAVPSGDSSASTSAKPLPDGLPRAFRCDDVAYLSVISAGTPLVLQEWYS